MPQRRLPELRLRVKVQGRHPRFHRKQVARPEVRIPPGSLVFVRDRDGRPVGTGFYNARAPVALRMLHRGKQPVDGAIILERLRAAIRLREETLGLGRRGDAYRLVHADGDGLPGLTLDRLGDFLVAQLRIKGLEPWMERIGRELGRHYPRSRLMLRIPRDVAEREGIEIPTTPPAGEAWLREEKLRYRFSPGLGHKTGFFCDQRENRLLLARHAKGRHVLDLFCHGAGFAMHTARAGAAKVRAVDLDEHAVSLARQNVEANSLPVSVEQADAFAVLRDLPPGSQGCLVLDPPSWAETRHELESGLVRYLDLNTLAFRALEPGGLLFTFCCAGPVSPERFLAVLREAASAARRDARVLHLGGAGADHPVALECQETRYLTAVLLEIR